MLPATNGAPEVETIRLIDEGEVEIAASDLLAAPSGEERTERDEAVEFLEAELGAGPKPMKELLRSAPCSEKTLRRAKSALGVKADKDGLTGPWVWSLPEDGHPLTSPVATFGERARPARQRRGRGTSRAAARRFAL